MRRSLLRGIGICVLVLLGLESGYGLDRTWIGGNVDWVDAGAATNWNPNDEPDADDRAIFNSANGVNLGSNNTVNGLALSGGIDLNTNGFDLTVDGLVEIGGASTNLFIGGAAGSIDSDDVTINSSGVIELAGGTLAMDEEVGTALLDINSGGTLQGHGVIDFVDLPGVATTVLVNDGTLTALSRGLTIFSPPPVGTLSIPSAGLSRVDLDGAGEAGVVNINRNQTLDLSPAMSDSFNGTMNLFHNSIFDSASGWALGLGGSLVIDDGFVDGGILSDIPAGVATIAGGTLTQTGGVINVVDPDGTLQFDAPFTMNGGTLTNNGLVIFNSNATIAVGANFVIGSGADYTVEAGRNVTINQTNFNMDGGLANATQITVNSGGLLTINVSDYDPDTITDDFDGVITLNSGDISVNTADAEFVMDGTLNMNAPTNGLVTAWSGEPIDIGNDAGALDADINVSGPHVSRISAQVDFNSDADVNVAAGGELQFGALVNFDTVNGVNNAEFTGGGALLFNGQVNVNEAATLNMVGGTVDLDGVDAVGDFINVDAPLTINAATMSSFGRVNGGGGVNTLDVNNSVGTGVLTVTLDDPAAEWTLNGPGVMNLVNDNSPATLLAGSDVNINGTVNVTGDVRTTARLDVAGVVNINTAAEPLRLAGGSSSDPNTIAGGTINGPGILGAEGQDLHGFGTINATVDFDGFANLLADNGMLTVNGSIVDVSVIGALGSDAILNVVNPWNTSVAITVLNEFGGEIRGGTITVDNPNGLIGKGLTSARVINNTRIGATRHFVGDSGTHVFQTVGNDNDWDGAGAGTLLAEQNHTLELRDVGAAFGFTGKVRAEQGGRVFANGFALDFNPGSTIELVEGTYESTSSTDIGGSLTLSGVSPSTIKVKNNFFLTFETGSSSTLNANLHVQNNNIIIEQGASFSGNGALVIPDGSHMVAENLANIGVLLDMQGAFRPGNSEGIGRVDLFDYQQANTGELFVELTGTALNAFDRLVASGDVVLDGFLSIDIDGAFVPSLGQTFNIITGNTVTGAFDYKDVSGMPAGLAFRLNYLTNAVQLEVVTKPIYAADFDDDGDVDLTDYNIWKGAFGLNQLGDANGDNISDAADYTIWRDTNGSVPGAAVVNGAAVPEPAAWVILALGLFLGARSSRSNRG